jgi:hypothetical protein
MSFGFPAYSNGSRHFNLDPQTLADLVSETLRVLRWPYQNPSPIKFVANISVSLWSWGERLSVDIAHDGTVTARSECAFPIQCIDWGRNGSNLRSFFDQLSRSASARAATEGQRGVP